MRAISHRAQANELFILAMMAKNIDNKALMCKRMMHELSAQAHELSISHRAQAHELLISLCAQAHELLITAATSMTRPLVRAQGIHITLLDSNNDNNYGDDDDKCRQRGLGRINDEASCASAGHFHIASRKCNDNNNNRQQRTTSVG